MPVRHTVGWLAAGYGLLRQAGRPHDVAVAWLAGHVWSLWHSRCMVCTTELLHTLLMPSHAPPLLQEAVVIAPRIAFALRPTMGEWYYIR